MREFIIQGSQRINVIKLEWNEKNLCCREWISGSECVLVGKEHGVENHLVTHLNLGSDNQDISCLPSGVLISLCFIFFIVKQRDNSNNIPGKVTVRISISVNKEEKKEERGKGRDLFSFLLSISLLLFQYTNLFCFVFKSKNVIV